MTLAASTPDVDEIANAIWVRLSNDATLETLLTTSGRIVMARGAPAGIPAPRLHCFNMSWDLDEYTGALRMIWQLRPVADNLHKGSVADRALLGDIIERAGTLVVGDRANPVFSRTGYQFMDSWLEGGFGPMIDPDAPELGYATQGFILRAHRL